MKDWNKELDMEALVVDRYEGEKAARQYLAKNKRKRRLKKLLTGIVATVTVIGLVVTLTYCTSDKEVPASTEETTTVETTTEPVEIVEEETTEVVKVDKECIVRDVVGDTITVECDGELYAFYGDGYAKGNKVICTFENEKITETSEPITLFFNVPLSEDLQLHIFNECAKYNIAPALVIAVIERESTFDPNALGDKGTSFGIMQVKPKYHQWRMDELGGSDWFNPYDNTAVGIHYLAELFGKYGDDIYMVLMEYNGGLGYANRMKYSGITSDYALEVTARAEQLEAEIYN